MATLNMNRLGVMAAGLLVTGEAASAQCVSYSVDILSGPDCQFESSAASVSGINEAGELCGAYYTCDKNADSAVWLGSGAWIPLTVAPGTFGFGPTDINSARQMSGDTRLIATPANPLAAYYEFSTHTMTIVGALPGGNRSEALGVNQNGGICGYSAGIGQPLTAFVWQDAEMTALPLPFGKSSVANDVSNTGLVCGWMGDYSLVGRAFVHNLAMSTTLDAGTALSDAVAAEAKGINNAGTICGLRILPCGDGCFTRRAFIWSDGVGQDLGILPEFTRSLAYAVNDSNVVVGYCDNFPGQYHRAFVWQNGVMQALNDLVPPELNLDIRNAWDINNAGQIVAQATRPGPNGTDTVAVRLTPIPSAIGDFDFNCIINVDDLLGVINHWNTIPGNPGTAGPADFTQDGIVNHADLAVVIENWTL